MVEQAKEREVRDVATLKALADPLRLAILTALMRRDPEPLSVKEIAADLGEAPTKLYRHIKQLEQCALILVAETRLVSGIVESRYLAAQHSLRLSPDVFADDDGQDRPEALGAMLAALDMIRSDFQGHFRSGRLDMATRQDGTRSPGKFAHFTKRVRPERVVRLRNQLDSLLDELAEEPDSTGEDAVDITLVALLYALRPANGAEQQ
ncbi:winged helix-turn-helix domain-containing protein [Kitasatospora cinereorecta]|uniref:Helix-turn-helix domain-containing protein n=1 Tax=Kitasatospora cinereorecta TaxID=285560 RepID=A0ABW0VFE3_9ACTN